jgi:hypothetical protein
MSDRDRRHLAILIRTDEFRANRSVLFYCLSNTATLFIL